MPRLFIDNQQVDVPEGTTILDAAARLGIEIPTLCHFPGCTPQTSCLVCLVKINGSGRLAPSCATVALEGMRVESETPDVQAMRRNAVELLLGEHCGDCFAPCQAVCPAHMDIPTMMRQIQAGDLHQAAITVKKAIPLPAVLGRICPELCEKGCRRGHRDVAVSICSLKRYVGDKDLASGAPYLPPRDAPSGKSVAIVGTGPSGLTAAWFLLQRGHEVTLYDDHALPGGALRYAIDEQRLPRAVLDGEIDLVRALGARFVMNTRIAGEAKLVELCGQFAAVLLAAGPLDAAGATALGMEFSGHGVKIDKKTMMTSRRGLFAAGSSLLPLRHAIRAVADGRAVAGAIDDFLSGREIAGKASQTLARMGHMSDPELERFFTGIDQLPRQSPPGGTPAGLSDEQAIGEAGRCAHCDCGKIGGCRLRQVAMKLHANPTRYRGRRREFSRIDTHPLVIYEPGKCILCGICVDIAQRAAEPLGLTFVGRGFDVVVSAPLGEDWSASLGPVARKCADACPTGALTMRDQTACPGGEDKRYVRLPLPVLGS